MFEDMDRPRGGVDCARNGFEEGGFSSAVGAEERDTLAWVDGELDTGQCVALPIAFMEIAYFECSGLSHPSSFEDPDEKVDANVVEVLRGRPSEENLVKGLACVLNRASWVARESLGFGEKRRIGECYQSRDRIDRG